MNINYPVIYDVRNIRFAMYTLINFPLMNFPLVREH